MMAVVHHNHMRMIAAVTAFAIAAFFAVPAHAAMTGAQRDALAAAYAMRADLQTAFDPVSWLPVDPERTAGIADLEDWARRYGYAEHPALLAPFAPAAESAPAGVSATAYVVMDGDAKETLLEKNASAAFPPGSAAKLMTALVLLDRGMPMDGQVTIAASDRIGGL